MKKLIVVLSVMLMIFSSCALVENLQDTGRVRIETGVSDSGRFLAEDGTSLIIAFLQQSDVYLFEEFENFGSTIEMNGILVGDYILLVMLVNDDDHMVGLASQEVTIESGVNYIDTTLGPGIWKLKLNGEKLDLTDLPSGYTVTVAENSIAFDVPDSEFSIDGTGPDFSVSFSTNAVESTFAMTENPAGVGYLESVVTVDDDANEVEHLDVEVDVFEGARSFILEVSDPVYNESFSYEISFK